MADFGHRQVFTRPGGGLRYNFRHCCGPSFRDDNAIGSSGVRGAENRTQVVRIFHTVEHYYERILSSLIADYIIEPGILFRRSDGHYALMSIISGHAIKLCTSYKTHRHALPPAFFHHALQTKIVALFGDPDPLEGARTGFQRLGDGIDSVDVIHERFSVM